jgi:hypothetical protein
VHTTSSTGVDKGAAISTRASGGTSQAGQHGTPPTSVPPGSASSRGTGAVSSTPAASREPGAGAVRPKA